MLNIDEFTNRLEELFRKFDLTPSTFADKIGVQRSSISHLLSGRNKPSLDFVLKVQDIFPEVELNWLLHGEGNLEKKVQGSSPTPQGSANLFSNISQPGFIDSKKESKSSNVERKEMKAIDNEQTNELKDISNISGLSDEAYGNQVDKIVIFYKNGTFKSFKPE